VEVHDADTDVIRVIAGSAVFVTGGRVIDPRTTAPGETRAPSVEGGDVRPIAAGDVLVVPAGTPHWFKSVDGTVRYFVVKVAK
jgi:mannose-6-phosphate isomerase-like protein (cupin superfamily)